jgi:hypothetical protein
MSTIKSSAEDLTLNADGSGNDIKFQSNGVEKASIDQDGNVAASGTITANGQAQLSNNNLIGGNTGATSTWIGKRTSSGDGVQIQTTNASGADTQRLAITCNADSADFTIKDSDIVFGTAGKGICLGVTTNTDANTLDDYEEGTFTPTVSADTVTYTTQIGRYTKIGNKVFIDVFVHINTITPTSSYSIILGLPFTSAATWYPALATKANGFSWGGSATMLTFQVQPSATTIGAAGAYNNGAFNDVNANGLAAGDWIAISGSYTV